MLAAQRVTTIARSVATWQPVRGHAWLQAWLAVSHEMYEGAMIVQLDHFHGGM